MIHFSVRDGNVDIEEVNIANRHRASTAARADFVVWLEQGQVRAVAPHRVLWGEAAYRALFGPDLFEPDPPSAAAAPEAARSGEVA